MDEFQPRPLRTFPELMDIEKVHSQTSDEAFMSLTSAWSPGMIHGGYGGHVYAQAVWAASQTVGESMVVHNVHGLFTLPAETDRPFIYTIERVSDGRSYCTRRVTARQPTSASIQSSPIPAEIHNNFPTAPFSIKDAQKELGKICFIASCSFKIEEAREWGHQETKDWTEYGPVLEGTKPWSHATAPSIDTPHWKVYVSANPEPLDFPGLDMRKVDMDPFNAGKPPGEYKQLTYYRTLGDLGGIENVNLHACAHLYASDRNSLFIIGAALGFSNRVVQIGTLSHSVLFHVVGKELLLQGNGADVQVDEEWYCQEAWTPRSEGGRGMHQSKIWRADGLHIASSWQDGLIRTAWGDELKRRVRDEVNESENVAEKAKL